MGIQLLPTSTTLMLSGFSLAVIAVKFLFLYLAKDDNSQISGAFKLFCSAVIINNIFEFSAYISSLYSNDISKMCAEFYSISLYLIAASLVNYCTLFSTFKWRQAIVWSWVVVGAILGCLHSTDLLVKDYAFNGYAWVRVPGDFYGVTSGYLGFAIVLSGWSLMFQSLKLSGELKVRSIISSIALAPFFIASIGILVLLSYEIETFAPAVVLPVTMIWLTGCFWLASNSNVLEKSAFLLFLPRFFNLAKNAAFNRGSLKDISKEYEKAVIEFVMFVYENQHSKVAEDLNVSRRTIERRIDEYDLD